VAGAAVALVVAHLYLSDQKMVPVDAGNANADLSSVMQKIHRQQCQALAKQFKRLAAKLHDKKQKLEPAVKGATKAEMQSVLADWYQKAPYAKSSVNVGSFASITGWLSSISYMDVVDGLAMGKVGPSATNQSMAALATLLAAQLADVAL